MGARPRQYAALLCWLSLGLSAFGASPSGNIPNDAELGRAFHTSFARPWVFSAKAGDCFLKFDAPAGKSWDLRACGTISVQAMRERKGESVARVRWVIASRAGVYCSAKPVVVPTGRHVPISVALDSAESDLIPAGHQAPWDSYAASEVSRLELRAECYFAPNAQGEEVSLSISEAVIEKKAPAPQAEPVLLDVSLQAPPKGSRAKAVLEFRIEPPPADPCSSAGDGDVRVLLSGGEQALAFFDQKYVSLSDGSATRSFPAGRPFYRALLPELPAGTLQVISGQRRWSVPAAGLTVAPASLPAGTEAGSTTPRWDAPLEVAFPALRQLSATAPAFWYLGKNGQWLPAPENILKNEKTLWRPVPFWTAQWGHFGGALQPNTELAARLDRLLETAAARGEAHPLAILDGASFERQEMFNWDHHPLRGALSGPGEMFRKPEGIEFCRRWMRYCVARWGSSAAVSCLCLTAALNTPGTADFHSLAGEALQSWMRDNRLPAVVGPASLPVISLHPLARTPPAVAPLTGFEPQDASVLAGWHADSRMGEATGGLAANAGADGGACYEVRARNAAGTSIGLTGTYAFGTPEALASADALMFDVWVPPKAPEDLRVGLHLCDRGGRWFETLLPGMLRPGDWTTFAVDLTAANFHGLRPLKHEAPWSDECRRRMTEVGLHVYSTHPNWKPAGENPLPVTARFDNVRGVRFDRAAVGPASVPVVIAAKEPEPQQVALIASFEGSYQRGAYAWNVDQRLGAATGSRSNAGYFELRARESNATTLGLVGAAASSFADYRGLPIDNFAGADALAFDVFVPLASPADLRAGVHVRDRDGMWFETLLPGVCHPGEWTTFALDLTAENYHQLKPIGHEKTWTDYSRQRLREIGVRVFSAHPNWPGGRGSVFTARVDNVRSIRFDRPAPARPVITFFDPTGSETPRSAGFRGELWECHLKVSKTFSNPFDPCECDLVAVITPPSGKEVRVPAFFNQQCQRREATPGGDEIVEAVGEEFFTVRYRLSEPGSHRVRFELREGGQYQKSENGEAASVSFVPGRMTATLALKDPIAVSASVRPGARPFHGFLRAASDNRHFEYDDGTFYYALGPCLRSPSDTRIPYLDQKWNEREIDRIGKRGSYQYDDYFAAFEKAGINWARVWMCSWWGALEWRRDWPGYQGLGRYNLLNAWRIDHILADAERKGIAISLCLTNHGQASVRIDHEWENNPLNAQYGGPLAAAREFFTSADAKIAHQNKLRYTVARYSHSPAILAWALFSELEFVQEFEGRNGYAANIDLWHAEMGAYLKAIDPNRHLVSTHYSHPNRGESTLAVPQVDIATSNAYSAFDELAHKSMDASAALFDFWSGNNQGVRGFKIFNKPALVEEQGRHWMGAEKGQANNTREQLDADLHAGLWGSMVLPLGGATGYWWWLHLHFDDRYSDYKALANFMNGEDLRPRKGESALEPVFRSLSNMPDLRGRALKSDRRLYGWVYHTRTPLGEPVPDVPGGIMRVSGLQPGTYTVEFWDTYRGVAIETRQLTAKAGASLEIPLPTVRRDLALKVKPR